MTTYIGYARCSRDKQDLSGQVLALGKDCGNRIFKEKKSGRSRAKRVELEAALRECKAARANGEETILVVYSLSRLSRSLKDMLALAEELQAHGIALKSLSESIDTSNPLGKAFFHIVSALAQMEVEQISMRTLQGLEAARARGTKLGRRPLKASVKAKVIELRSTGSKPQDIAKALQISETSVYQILRAS